MELGYGVIAVLVRCVVNLCWECKYSLWVERRKDPIILYSCWARLLQGVERYGWGARYLLHAVVGWEFCWDYLFLGSNEAMRCSFYADDIQ